MIYRLTGIYYHASNGEMIMRTAVKWIQLMLTWHCDIIISFCLPIDETKQYLAHQSCDYTWRLACLQKLLTLCKVIQTLGLPFCHSETLSTLSALNKKHSYQQISYEVYSRGLIWNVYDCSTINLL